MGSLLRSLICAVQSSLLLYMTFHVFHVDPWWRHQLKHFPRNWPFFEGNPPVTGDIPSQRTVTRSFVVFYDLRLNKRLSKQSGRRWFGALSHSLWRHCNAIYLPRCHLFFSFVKPPLNTYCLLVYWLAGVGSGNVMFFCFVINPYLDTNWWRQPPGGLLISRLML